MNKIVTTMFYVFCFLLGWFIGDVIIDRYNKKQDMYMQACHDSFAVFEYKLVNDTLYCYTLNRWEKHQ